MEVYIFKTIVLLLPLIYCSEMNNKKIFLFAFLSLFLIGCDSIGGVNLTDTRGNKYNFKNESVYCEKLINGNIMCEGSAIKTDIAGKRYVVEFESEYCKSRDGKIFNYFLCSAAKEMGKL